MVPRSHARDQESHHRACQDIDVVIELLDARLPGSSANPMLAQLTGTRPKLKVLNKQDLADPERTQQWLDWYNSKPDTGPLRWMPAKPPHPAPDQGLPRTGP